jgi:aminoglycoside 3-N-acetyltransferase
MNQEKEAIYWKEFHECLDRLGIGKGDILYVGSDIAAVVVLANRELEFKGREDRDVFLNHLVDAIKEHVGEEGTLLVPVYSWKWCKGEPFDYYKTQGEVGAYNNFVLNNRSDFKRTKHPIYSFMVWGKDAEMLCAMNNQEAWGEASPFYYLHHNGGKEFDINVSGLRSMTFKHYVEMSCRVPYRYPKYFLADYTDESGVTEERCYSMYVRDLNVSMKSSQNNAFFEEHHVGQTEGFHGYELHVIDLPKAYEALKDDILNNGAKNVYHFENYTPDFTNVKKRYEVGYRRDKELVK